MQLGTADGVRIAGATTGRSRRGVVFAHESDGTLCNWIRYAGELAGRGVRVLVLDHRGHGSSADVAADRALDWDRDIDAAVRSLRRDGVDRVAVVGASAGGTAALVAASRPNGADAVASLSGPAGYGPLDAVRAAPKLKVPALFLVGADDRGFPADARRLAALTRAPHRLVVVPDDGWHGTSLLDDPIQGSALAEQLTRFLLTALAGNPRSTAGTSRSS